MNDSAHGGVGHLLRMAKTQCGVAVAFAALRKPDGGFAIATFPSMTADPSWSVETIDELVRQTWDDPELRSGKVLVRSGRVLRGMWAGQAHHTKLAAAPLSDFDAPERPWGLICVAEPIAGHFEQDQLDLLGTLAIRLTSYLRARQEVMEGSSTFDEGLRADAVPPAEEPAWSQTDVVVAQAETSVPTAPVAPEPAGTAAPPYDESDFPLRSGAEPNGSEHLAPGMPAATQVPTPAPASPVPSVPAVREVPSPVAPSRPAAEAIAVPPVPEVAVSEPPVGAVPPEAPPAPPEATGEAPQPSTGPETLGSLLRPDPVTGLPGLPTLLGRLGEAMGRVGSNKRTVALVLLELVPNAPGGTAGDEALRAVVEGLRGHLREDDLVTRIDGTMFAVVVNLRPDGARPETIEQRLWEATGAALTSAGDTHRARSSVAAADERTVVGPEELLRQVANRLGFP